MRAHARAQEEAGLRPGGELQACLRREERRARAARLDVGIVKEPGVRRQRAGHVGHERDTWSESVEIRVERRALRREQPDPKCDKRTFWFVESAELCVGDQRMVPAVQFGVFVLEVSQIVRAQPAEDVRPKAVLARIGKRRGCGSASRFRRYLTAGRRPEEIPSGQVAVLASLLRTGCGTDEGIAEWCGRRGSPWARGLGLERARWRRWL